MGGRSLIILAVFGSSTLFAYALLKSPRTARIGSALYAHGGESPATVVPVQLSKPLLARLLPGLGRFGAFVARITPLKVLDRLRRELAYAGDPPRWDAEKILALKVLAAVVLPGLGLAAGVFGTSARTPLIAAVLAALGYQIPDLVLKARYRKRQTQIADALSDTLDLLAITVEAGLGFDSAVARVAQESGGPLGEELYRMIQEMQLGKTRPEALRDLAERSTLPELKSFVLSMVQADIFGVSIAKVLKVQSNELRTKRRQAAEEKAQKIPVKIVFPLVFCIFPCLFVVLVGPAAIRIYQALF